MSTTRKIATKTGVVFIIATATALVAAATVPEMTGNDLLSRLAGANDAASIGALCYIIAAFTSVGIAVLLYPVVKQVGTTLAMSAVVFRTLEAAMYLVAVVSLLDLQTIARQIGAATAANHTSLQVIGDSIVSANNHATLLGVFAFSLGALSYYIAFYRSRLIPRWLSVWGIVAIAVMLAACLSSVFHDKPITSYTLHVLPIALQEMVLAIWLLVKGFDATTIEKPSASEPSLSGADS